MSAPAPDALHDALRAGDLRLVSELLAADPGLAAARDAEGVSAVARAVYAFRPDLVHVLLAAEPPLDLFDAAMLGRADALPALLAATPDGARAWSADGFTALQLACFFGHRDAARLLLDAGAEAEATSRNGLAVAPLNAAAAGHHPDVVAELLRWGVDVNVRSAGGHTPLMAAAAAADETTIELLLAQGADTGLIDEAGRSAADHAHNRGHDGVAERVSGRPTP